MDMMLNIQFMHTSGDIRYKANMAWADWTWNKTVNGNIDDEDLDIADKQLPKIAKRVKSIIDKKLDWRSAAWNLRINRNIHVYDTIQDSFRVLVYITIDLDEYDRDQIQLSTNKA